MEPEIACCGSVRQDVEVRIAAGEGSIPHEARIQEARTSEARPPAVADSVQFLTASTPRLLLTHESRPVRRERVLVQTADDQMMLLDLDGGMYFALNDVGARVWELCDGTRTVAEISSLLANEYDAPAAMIEGDVLELLGELETEQLVAPA